MLSFIQRELELGGIGGGQERDSGPAAHPKNCISPPPHQKGRPIKSLCLGKNRSGCSIGIAAAADVLIYQRKMCSKEMKNPGMSHRSRSRL